LLFITCFCTNGILAQTVDFTANPACYGDPTTLLGTSTLGDTAIASWLWDLDGDGMFNDANGKTIINFFSQADTFLVHLKTIPNTGPADSVIRQVVVHPLPQVNFNMDNLCEGETAVFTDNSSIASGSINQYLWDFNNDGNVDDNSGPVVTFNNGPAGAYVTKLECVSDIGCSSSTVKPNEVFSKPAAGFTVQNTLVDTNTAFVNNTTITNGSVAFYLWNFGDGVTSTLQDPTHKYDSAQTYNVRLVAVSDNNCRDTVYLDVVIEPRIITDTTDTVEELNVKSNLLTPNDDGFNDFLEVGNLSSYQNCEITIYNRWNDQVFSSSSYQNDWKGEALDAGTYFYIIRCDDTEIMGSINILR